MNVSTDRTYIHGSAFIMLMVQCQHYCNSPQYTTLTIYNFITALMNELHKLRTDNQYLLGKIDATSVDALDLLESQMADQKCVNTSLQVIQ